MRKFGNSITEHTLEIVLDENQSGRIRSLIEKADNTRTWLTCTVKSSYVLKKSGLFEGINQVARPKKLLNQLLSYFDNKGKEANITRYDLEKGTSEKIEIKKKGCTK